MHRDPWNFQNESVMRNSTWNLRAQITMFNYINLHMNEKACNETN